METIQVRSAGDLHGVDKLADTRRTTPGIDGGYVPGRLAGYTYDGAAYCPDCADETEIATPDGDGEVSISHFPAFETNHTGCGVGIVNGMEEADYPGLTCFVCHQYLDTNVLVYRDGPGSEEYVEE